MANLPLRVLIGPPVSEIDAPDFRDRLQLAIAAEIEDLMQTVGVP